MRVIVVGAGVGGLAAALALARRGASVTVLERATSFGEVGAGVQLAPNATRLLKQGGLGAALERVGFAPRSAQVRDSADGRVLLGADLGAAAERRWGSPYLQMHRADLHGLLLQAATAAGADLRTDSEVQALEQEDGAVVVRAGGSTVKGDVLVGADGIRSRIRHAVAGETPTRFTGQIAWRGLVDAASLPAGLIAPDTTVWTSAGAHFVHYFVRGGALVNFVGFTMGRLSTESWSEAAAPGEIARTFAGWPEPVTALVDAHARAGDVGWRLAVHDRPLRAGWARGRIALLGDAAHPMRPYLAQGAGMAIEDAEALARHLYSPLSPQAALQAYAAERHPRVRRVQQWAERNGRVFHLPRPLRRAAFAAARAGAADLDWLYGYVPPSG